MAFKLLSISPRFYRYFGNQFGGRRRIRRGIPDYYGKRAKKFISWIEKYQMVKDGDAVLEVGTGWVHFESIVIRLFYDVEATLFDVWDNRQLDALKLYFSQLEELIYHEMDLSSEQKKRVRQIIELITDAETFDRLYQDLQFQYVINPNGNLKSIKDASCQFVYSYNVLEHVDRKTVPNLIHDIHRVLKPGGFSYHDIDITDHLISFARTRDMHRKYYMRFSDKTWKRYFDNKVQYINRIQCPEWLAYFHQSGLELVEKETVTDDMDSIQVANSYNQLEKDDLGCTRLRVVHRKSL